MTFSVHMDEALTQLKELSIGKSSLLKKHSFPDFVYHRMRLFDQWKAEHEQFIAAQPKSPIKISVNDKIVNGTSFESTPMKVLLANKELFNNLAPDSAVIARVDGALFDLDRPLEGDCRLEVLDFDSHDDAKMVFWHSSAHVLGEALEGRYHGCLCYGPPLESGGFYYDIYLDFLLANGEAATKITSGEFKTIEAFCQDIIKDKQKFERLEVSLPKLKEMFSYNPFKLRIIDTQIKTDKTTVYRCGPLIDLCLGPHIRHTGLIKALAVTKNSSSYWHGDASAESLQRVYGISFPSKQQLAEYKAFQEEAAKRDHRKIGKDQELFFFNELSPGSCFFLPKGAFIYNTLSEFMREQYHFRGFTEVISPNMYNVNLWKTSGHFQHYAENMFSFEIEKEKFALKPMNCPGHCVMFGNRTRSWRELPMRYADFGVLHRNELSGALTGLTRVRRFCQDDAHIFCTLDQVESEIMSCLDFLSFVYRDVFQFQYKLMLSTRPADGYLGELAVWDTAEKQLAAALNSTGMKWELNEGDGAFYGPKIDIQIQDALKRYHQCATIQLDFNLPERFNLQYVNKEGGFSRPVMVHRAILGSVERMIAILCEHYGGKWPLWLSPNQVIVIPTNSANDEYCNAVRDRLHGERIMVVANTDPSESLNKKVRNAKLAFYNYICVVGEKEKENGSVSVRCRNDEQLGEIGLERFVAGLKRCIQSRSNGQAEF